MRAAQLPTPPPPLDDGPVLGVPSLQTASDAGSIAPSHYCVMSARCLLPVPTAPNEM